MPLDLIGDLAGALAILVGGALLVAWVLVVAHMPWRK